MSALNNMMLTLLILSALINFMNYQNLIFITKNQIEKIPKLFKVLNSVNAVAFIVWGVEISLHYVNGNALTYLAGYAMLVTILLMLATLIQVAIAVLFSFVRSLKS